MSMRFQEALLLQKEQASQAERQNGAQRQLEKAAAEVEGRFQYWCQFRDPIAESLHRIEKTLIEITTQEKSLSNPKIKSESITGEKDEESILDGDEKNLDQTTFNLYRKLKYGK